MIFEELHQMRLFFIILVVLCINAVCHALPARPMDQIEHIVIFMQENRPYDHYFGTLKGVRGFNDRAATPMRNGQNTFYQPVTGSNQSYMLPFHVSTLTTSAICMDAPTMEYFCDIAMLDNGYYDKWNTARPAGMGMSYFNRTDLPYYYALYDGFTTGDQYFMSTYTATNPNRLHVFSGSNGLSVGQQPCIDDIEPGFNWITMGEVLEAANISWKVYQQADNFDDNANAWFNTYRNAKPGEPLYDKGMARSVDLIADFNNDMQAGKLPQVSWLVAPANMSEHASYHPSAGEDFTARILKAVQANPSVYAKMAFILNYDEGGQFFDHSWTPNVPLNQPTDGISTVDTTGEVWDRKQYGNWTIGPGFRVPLLVISPWSRGNIVVSETFDHTSVMRMVEERFNVHLPTISPWRRAMMGDIFSAFDFQNPDYSWPTLPDTSGYPDQSNTQCSTLPPPEVPAQQSFPTQEKGTRISRALPYEFQVSDKTTSDTFSLTISVTGARGAAFIFYDASNFTGFMPRKYTVDSLKSITDTFSITGKKDYSFALYGPNGFVRQFAGSAAGAALNIAAKIVFGKSNNSVGIAVAGASTVTYDIFDNAYGQQAVMGAKGSGLTWFNTSGSGNWYDFTVRDTTLGFQRRFMGRMETGKDTISDPAMGAGLPTNGPGIASLSFQDVVMSRSVKWEDHPLLPDSARKFQRREGVSKDSKYHPSREERGIPVGYEEF